MGNVIKSTMLGDTPETIYPCVKCAHEKVCSVKECFKEMEIQTTHPYIKVELKCKEFYPKPTQGIR